MSTVSAVLIVKNEAQALAACLDKLHWADEIIVLDSGSADNTLTIAKDYTDKVFVNDHWPGFGKQRQLAQGYASGDWIFALDADEHVSEALIASIQQAVKLNDQQKVFSVNRKNWAFGKFMHHSGWSPDWVVRLYPREHTAYSDALVHEQVLVTEGVKVQQLDGDLYHYTYQNLYDYNKKVIEYLKAWADDREGKKKSGIGKALLHGFGAFVRMYIIKRGFLDGRHGFILALLTAYTTTLKYTDLWLRQYRKSQCRK
ncbi:MAG: glycosyltransferase family 2 protein [Cellvibrionaceae bacterium]|nr:glycosyltransferase family 2 protein [Cellvibrionaceae bacterium]